jgi:hypothetical protein
MFLYKFYLMIFTFLSLTMSCLTSVSSDSQFFNSSESAFSFITFYMLSLLFIYLPSLIMVIYMKTEGREEVIKSLFFNLIVSVIILGPIRWSGSSIEGYAITESLSVLFLIFIQYFSVLIVLSLKDDKFNLSKLINKKTYFIVGAIVYLIVMLLGNDYIINIHQIKDNVSIILMLIILSTIIFSMISIKTKILIK